MLNVPWRSSVFKLSIKSKTWLNSESLWYNLLLSKNFTLDCWSVKFCSVRRWFFNRHQNDPHRSHSHSANHQTYAKKLGQTVNLNVFMTKFMKSWFFLQSKQCKFDLPPTDWTGDCSDCSGRLETFPATLPGVYHSPGQNHTYFEKKKSLSNFNWIFIFFVKKLIDFDVLFVKNHKCFSTLATRCLNSSGWCFCFTGLSVCEIVGEATFGRFEIFSRP